MPSPSLLIIGQTPDLECVSIGLYAGDKSVFALVISRKLAALVAGYAGSATPFLSMLGKSELAAPISNIVDALKAVLGGAPEVRRNLPPLPEEFI